MTIETRPRGAVVRLLTDTPRAAAVADTSPASTRATIRDVLDAGAEHLRPEPPRLRWRATAAGLTMQWVTQHSRTNHLS